MVPIIPIRPIPQLASELSCVEILRGVQTFLPLVANRQRLEKR